MAIRRKKEASPAATAQAGREAAVYLITGDEYLVASSARDLVDRVCPPADQTLGLEIVDARVDTVAEAEAALRECLQGLCTLGFFGGRKTVWLRDATFLADRKTSGAEAVKAATDALVAQIKQGLPEGVRFVISAPGLDKRSALYKACDAQGVVESHAVAEKPWMADKLARERTAELFTQRRLKVDPAAAEALLRKTGTDTRQIAQEIDKLAVYLGDRREVTLEDVETIASSAREALAWDLADAVGHRDLNKAVAALRQLFFQGENAIGMVAVLAMRCRELVLLKECLARGWCRLRERGNFTDVDWSQDPAVDEALAPFDGGPRKMHPYRLGLLVPQAGKYSRRELLEAHRMVIDAQERLVSTSMDPALALEFLVLRIIGPIPTQPVGGG